MFIDKRLLRNVDICLVLAVLAISIIGLVVLYSATQSEAVPMHRFKKQVVWVLLGFAAVLLVISIDYRALERFYYPLYIGNILLLGFVNVWGGSEAGAQRWFRIGGISVQPSEFAKISVILTLAYSMSLRKREHSLWDVCVYIAHVALPMLLIIKQPDLGTGLVLVGILVGMMMVANVPFRYIFLLLFSGLAVSPIAYRFFLTGYQRNRLLAFIDPTRDRFGIGYNIIQSRIAIGSGGIVGKGYLSGTQTQLSFLPARYSDFVFSVFCEEFGFIGACVLLLLFLVLLWRSLWTTLSAKDEYGRLVAAGVASLLFTHVMTNVGMSLAIMPVTGIPLPFVSQGGSSLFATMIGIGLLLNVQMRRRKLTFH